MFKLKRAYDPVEESDGKRYLVDRLWPRGIKKEALHIEDWVKDASPSDALRHEFHKAPEKWEAFRRGYFAELDAHPESWKPLVEAARHHPVTLLYAAKDTEHNNAVALAEYLRSKT
jgi:uncharacterized protein YeaO (DUF488 family)